jgi:hypothetical protein
MSKRRVRRPQPTTDKRSPEERLEALVRETNLDRAARMLERIEDDLDASREPAPWIAAARTLSERLIISENAFYYFAELFCEPLLYAAATTDPELVRLSTEMRSIEATHGVRDGDYWMPDEATPEWLELNEEWDRLADSFLAKALRGFGHGDVADLRERNLDGFMERVRKGEEELWGSDDEDLDDEIASPIYPDRR